MDTHKRGDLAIPLAGHDEVHHSSSYSRYDDDHAQKSRLDALPSYIWGKADASTSSIQAATHSRYYHANIDCFDGGNVCTSCVPLTTAAIACILICLFIILPLASVIVCIVLLLSGLIILCSGRGMSYIRIHKLIKLAQDEVHDEATRDLLLFQQQQEPQQTHQFPSEDPSVVKTSIHPGDDVHAREGGNAIGTTKNWADLSGTYMYEPNNNNNNEGCRMKTMVEGRTIDLVVSEFTPSLFSYRANALFGNDYGRNKGNSQHKRLWKISGHSMSIVSSPSIRSDGRQQQPGPDHSDDVRIDPNKNYTTIRFVISQGLLANSGKVYWVEQHHDVASATGDVNSSNALCSPARKRIVLVQGTIDYDTQRFTDGTWTDSHGDSGVYPPLTRLNRVEGNQNESDDDVPDYNMDTSQFNDDIDEERDPSISKGSIRGGFSRF